MEELVTQLEFLTSWLRALTMAVSFGVGVLFVYVIHQMRK